jgi:hypothetical protein
MKRRTIDEINIEIEELKLIILDVKATIHEDEPDWREPTRRKTGDIGPGYIPLAERRERIKLLEAKVDRLMKERDVIKANQSGTSGKKFGHGQLKENIGEMATRDGLKLNKSVPGTKINKWIKELMKKGYHTSAGSIRAVLSDLGYTKEIPRKN